MSTKGRADGRVRGAVRGAGLASIVVLLLAGTAWASQHDVEVVDDAFSPETVTITAGETVRWMQTGSNPHTVTADDESWDSHEDCRSFADAGDGGCMEQGESYQRTFDEPGEYGYFCRIHGSPGAGMAGTVVVEAAEGSDEPQDDAPAEDAPVEDETDETDGAEALPETGAGIAALVLTGLLALLGGALYLWRREA